MGVILNVDARVSGQTQVARLNNSVRDLGSASQVATNAFRALTAVIAGAGFGALAVRVTRASDAIRSLNAQLVSTGSRASTAARQVGRVAQIAQQTGSSFEDVAGVLARLQRSTRDFGASTEDVATSATAIQQSFRLSGATAAEASSSATQLAQALSSGTLRGEELNSILENNAVLAGAIRTEFNATNGELRDLARTNSLTAERVFQGILNSAEDINNEFQNFGNLYEQSAVRIRNASSLILGEIGIIFDEITGINTAIRGFTQNIVDAFEDGTLRQTILDFVFFVDESFAKLADGIRNAFGRELFDQLNFDDVLDSLRAIYGLSAIRGIGLFGITQAVNLIRTVFSAIASRFDRIATSLRSLRTTLIVDDISRPALNVARVVNSVTEDVRGFFNRVRNGFNFILQPLRNFPGVGGALRVAGLIARVAGRVIPFVNIVFFIFDAISAAFDDMEVRNLLNLEDDERITTAQRVLAGIAGGINGFVGAISDGLAFIARVLGLDETSTEIMGLGDDIEDLVDTVTSALNTFYSSVNSSLSGVVEFFGVEIDEDTNLIDTAISSIVSGLSALVRGVTSAVEGIVFILTSTQQERADAYDGSAFMMVVDDIRSSISDIVSAIQLSFTNLIINPLVAGATAVREFFTLENLTEILMDINDAITDIIDTISESFDTYVVQPIDNSITALIAIYNGPTVQNAIMSVMETVSDIIDTITESFDTYIVKPINDVVDDIVALYTSPTVQNTLNLISTRIQSVRDTIVNTITTYITTPIQTIITSIAGFFMAGTLQTAIDLIETTVTNIRTAISNALATYITDPIEALITQLGMIFMDNILTTAFNKVSTTVDSMVMAVTGVFDYLSGIVESITGFFTLDNLLPSFLTRSGATETPQEEEEDTRLPPLGARRRFRATGGIVTGPGSGTSDSILARLSNGEFVINAEATRDYLPLLEEINNGGLPQYQTGGQVGEGGSRGRLRNLRDRTEASLAVSQDRIAELTERLLTATDQGNIFQVRAATRDLNLQRSLNDSLEAKLDEQTEALSDRSSFNIGDLFSFNFTEIAENLQMTLSRELSSALRSGDFSNIGDALLDTLTTNIIDSFAENISSELFDSLDSLFEDFDFSALGESISGIFTSITDSIDFSAIFSTISTFLGFANNGGVVPNTPNSRRGVDSVPYLLTPGERIIPAGGQAPSGSDRESVVVNIPVTGDISLQTRREITQMLPEIIDATQATLEERRVLYNA